MAFADNKKTTSWLFQPILKICLVKLDHLPHRSGWAWKIFELPPPKQGKPPPLRAYSRDLSRGQLACDPEKTSGSTVQRSCFGYFGCTQKNKKTSNHLVAKLWICRGFLFVCPLSYMGVWHDFGSRRRFWSWQWWLSDPTEKNPSIVIKMVYVPDWIQHTHGIYVSYESYLIDHPQCCIPSQIHDLTPNSSSCSKKGPQVSHLQTP